MLKARVIPCLDVKDGRVVKGVNFVDLKDAGDPVEAAEAYDAAGADELCFLDITASHERRGILLDVVRRTAEHCFMPLTVGGGVRTLEDVRDLLLAGADKVSINTAAVRDSDFVRRASEKFGAQCIVVAIDAKQVAGGGAAATGTSRQEARSGEAATGTSRQEARSGEAATGKHQEARSGEAATGTSRQEARSGEAATGTTRQEAKRAEGPTGTKRQEARSAEAATGTSRQEAWRAEGPTGTSRQEAGRAERPTGTKKKWEIFTHGGRKPTGIDALEFADKVVALGAGEILLTSMDRDGTKQGFDIALTRAVADRVSVPVIASGGVGTLDHLVEGVREGHASAVLAASIFHFGEHTIGEAKRHMAAAGVPVRLDPPGD